MPDVPSTNKEQNLSPALTSSPFLHDRLVPRKHKKCVQVGRRCDFNKKDHKYGRCCHSPNEGMIVSCSGTTKDFVTEFHCTEDPVVPEAVRTHEGCAKLGESCDLSPHGKCCELSERGIILGCIWRDGGRFHVGPGSCLEACC